MALTAARRATRWRDLRSLRVRRRRRRRLILLAAALVGLCLPLFFLLLPSDSGARPGGCGAQDCMNTLERWIFRSGIRASARMFGLRFAEGRGDDPEVVVDGMLQRALKTRRRTGGAGGQGPNGRGSRPPFSCPEYLIQCPARSRWIGRGPERGRLLELMNSVEEHLARGQHCDKAKETLEIFERTTGRRRSEVLLSGQGISSIASCYHLARRYQAVRRAARDLLCTGVPHLQLNGYQLLCLADARQNVPGGGQCRALSRCAVRVARRVWRSGYGSYDQTTIRAWVLAGYAIAGQLRLLSGDPTQGAALCSRSLALLRRWPRPRPGSYGAGASSRARIHALSCLVSARLLMGAGAAHVREAVDRVLEAPRVDHATQIAALARAALSSLATGRLQQAGGDLRHLASIYARVPEYDPQATSFDGEPVQRWLKGISSGLLRPRRQLLALLADVVNRPKTPAQHQRLRRLIRQVERLSPSRGAL